MKKTQRIQEAEATVDKRFDSSVTDRERAIFEGAITLGALYHQFVGVPIIRDPGVLRRLERMIEETMSLQPYKERVRIRIRDSEVRGRRANPYDYSELEGRMLEAEVVSRYRGCRATLAMKYVPELKYNLMYIKRLETLGGSKGQKHSQRGTLTSRSAPYVK